MRDKIERFVFERFGGESEGLAHTKRVYAVSKKLSTDYDDEILHAACFLHDINLDKPHPKMAAQEAERFLTSIGFPEEKRNAVVGAIAEHGYYGNPDSKEAFMLFDADQLDAMGCGGYSQFAGTSDDPDRLEGFMERVEGECVSVLKLTKSKELAAARIAHRKEILRMMREEMSLDPSHHKPLIKSVSDDKERE